MIEPPIQLHTPEEIGQQLAERVRAERLLGEWKQETLAERSGVSLPTVRRYERTGRTSIGNLLKLCHALGRLDEFSGLLRPAPAVALEEFEARSEASAPKRKRGVR